MNLRKLVKLANRYDLKGEYAKADALDLILKKASDAGSLKQTLEEGLYDLEKPEFSLKDTLTKIEGMKENMMILSKHGEVFSSYILSLPLRILDEKLKGSLKNVDAIKEAIFPMLEDVVISALEQYKHDVENDNENPKFESFDGFNNTFGYNFISQMSYMAYNEDSGLEKDFANYIAASRKVLEVLNSIKPQGKYEYNLQDTMRTDPLQELDIQSIRDSELAEARMMGLEDPEPSREYRMLEEIRNRQSQL